MIIVLNLAYFTLHENIQPSPPFYKHDFKLHHCVYMPRVHDAFVRGWSLDRAHSLAVVNSAVLSQGEQTSLVYVDLHS